MRLSRYMVSISAGLAILTSVPVAAAYPVRTVQPQALILQPAEVPGFKASQSHPLTNDQLARENRVNVSDFTRVGRIIGYRVVYHRAATSGIAQITNTVAIYRKAAGARQSFAGYRTSILKSFPGAQSGHVGDESVLFSQSTVVHGTALIQAAIAFQAGQYRAYLAVDGRNGPTVIPQLLADARLIFTHMQRAGISER